MNLVGVVIWWIVVVALLLTLVILWFKRIINNSVAGLLLMLLIIMVIIGILWFSSWGDVNDNTLQPGQVYWYTSTQNRSFELDSSIITVKLVDANNNSQLSTVNLEAIGATLITNNISINTSAGSRYVVRISNNSSTPVNITVSSTKLTFTGPSKTAP